MATGYSDGSTSRPLRADSEDSSNCSEDDYSGGTTPSSSSDDDYEPIWVDNIGTKGDLLYVEPNILNDSSLGKYGHQQYDGKGSASIKEASKSKSKGTTKLRQWIKRRKKKIAKDIFSASSEKGGSSSLSSLTPKVTFKASDHGEVKVVLLDVDSSRHNYGRRATLSEKLFGLVLSPFSNSSSGSFGHDERVMVSALIPHGEATREGTIKVGDWLKNIDDDEVSFSNLNDVLTKISSPQKVKLVVQRFAGEEISSTSQFSNSHSFLVKQLVGDPAAILKSKLDCVHIPHAVYFLSLKPEYVGEEKDNVVYQYPEPAASLYKLKGMFITLGHMISDVCTPPVLSCTVLVDEQIIHIGFVMEGEDMMIFALPSSCGLVSEVQHFSTALAKLLKLQFITLAQAFGDPENKDYLDNFFAMYFHRLLLPLIDVLPQTIKRVSHLLDILPSVHWLPLPADIKILVDDILSQFESAGFGDTCEGYYGIRRMFNILGACFFYKGCLLGSHLQKEDLLDMHLFLQCHGMLTLSQTLALSRAIVWKEIFPSRKHSVGSSMDSGYEEADGRYFLLIVASKHSILGAVLEAGGCALSVTGYPSPEPFYVELVENTVMLFEDSGIFPAVNRIKTDGFENQQVAISSDEVIVPPKEIELLRMEMQTPQLACPETFLKGEKTNWDILSSIVGINISSHGPHSSNRLSKRSRSYSNLSSDGNKKSSDVSFGLKKSGERDVERQQLLSNMGPADGESDVETNAASDDLSNQKHSRRRSISTSSNTGSHESEENMPSSGTMLKRIFNSTYDLRSIHSSHDRINVALKEECSKLVAGSENTLFHYVHMDPVEGVFLAPISHVQMTLKGDIGQEVIQSFQRCCLSMRSMFERSLRNKELALNSVAPKYGLNTFLQAVHEQGALFQCHVQDEQKKTQLVLDFWVIGRLFFSPEPREVYVCYHNSTQQNVVELAFRLGFGLSL